MVIMSCMYETLVELITGKNSIMIYPSLEGSVMSMLDHLALIVTHKSQSRWEFVLIMIGSRITNLCNIWNIWVFPLKAVQEKCWMVKRLLERKYYLIDPWYTFFYPCYHAVLNWNLRIEGAWVYLGFINVWFS